MKIFDILIDIQYSENAHVYVLVYVYYLLSFW